MADDNVNVRVRVTGTRQLKDMTGAFDDLMKAADQVAEIFKKAEEAGTDLNKVFKVPPGGFPPPPDDLGLPELPGPLSTATGTYMTPEEELAFKNDILNTEKNLLDLTDERLKIEHDLAAEYRDILQSADSTAIAFGSFKIDKDRFAELRKDMTRITEGGMSAGFRAAITGHSVKDVMYNTLADIATKAFMEAIGSRLASMLVGGGIPFLPFFQKGGYTGTYEGLAWMHPHEFNIPRDVFLGTAAPSPELQRALQSLPRHETRFTVPSEVLSGGPSGPGVSSEVQAALSNPGLTPGAGGISFNVNVTEKLGEIIDVKIAQSADRGNMIRNKRVVE